VFLGVNDYDDVNASEYLFRKKTDKPNPQQPVKVMCQSVVIYDVGSAG
jgi:hypothetical protein